MNFNAEANLRQVNNSLSIGMRQQQKKIYSVVGIKENYTEPVPNNYSFILFHGKQKIIEKINKQAKLYEPLNRLNQGLYDYYLHLNINFSYSKELKAINSILYSWNNLILQGHYFLTWKLFVKLDEMINDLKINQNNKQKHFIKLSKSLPKDLLNEWEVGLAISQDELEYALGLIVAKLTEYKIKPKSIEVSKIFTKSHLRPSFPTIKLNFYSYCCKKELTELCFDIINIIRERNLVTGDITQGFGENHTTFLRMQNGFEGLKRILNQMNTIDNFYYPKYDYAYRKIGMKI